MTAETISFMIPNRNRPARYLRNCLYSLSRQTRRIDEIVVSDMSTQEPFKSETEQICKDYNVKYVHTEVPREDVSYEDYKKDMEDYREGIVYPWNRNPSPKPWVNIIDEDRYYDRYVDLYLHTLCYNVGLRHTTKDLVVWFGQDTLLSKNGADVILNMYNHERKRGRIIIGRIWYLPQRRKITLKDIDNWEEMKTWNGFRWRGGFGFICTSRKWLYKIQGFDQTLRWYNDNDLLKRAKMDNCGLSYCGLKRENNNGLIPGLKIPDCQVYHQSHTTKKPRNYGDRAHPEVAAFAKRGKYFINRYCITPIMRNDENWGIYNKDVGFWHQIWKKCHARHTKEEMKYYRKKAILAGRHKQLEAKLTRE